MSRSTHHAAVKLPSLYASAPSLFSGSSRLVSTSSRGHKASQKNAPTYPKPDVQKKRNAVHLTQFHYNYDPSPFSERSTLVFNNIVEAINSGGDSGLRPYYSDLPEQGKVLSAIVDEVLAQDTPSPGVTAPLKLAKHRKVDSSKNKSKHLLPKNEPVDDMDIADPFGMKAATAFLEKELFGGAKSGKAPAEGTKHLRGAEKELVDWINDFSDKICLKK